MTTTFRGKSVSPSSNETPDFISMNRTKATFTEADSERPCVRIFRGQTGLFGFGHVDECDFIRPRFKHLDGYPWLVYRFVAAMFLTVVIAVDGATYGHHSNPCAWPAYLTNITLLTQVALFWFKLIVTVADTKPRGVTSQDGATGATIKTRHYVLWLGNTVVTTAAILVTILFWAAVFDPTNHGYSFVNLGKHFFNSVLVMSDLVLSRVPFRLQHFYIPFLYGAFYLTYSYAYWAAGGRGNEGEPHLYNVLRWDRFDRAFSFGAASLAAVVGIHCCVCVVSWGCDRAEKSLNKL